MKKKKKNLFLFSRPTETEPIIIEEKENQVEYDVRQENPYPKPEVKVSDDIDKNLEYLEKLFLYPKNSDIVFRKMKVGKGENERQAFILFIDGMVDTQLVDLAVIEPLIKQPEIDQKDEITADEVLEKLMYHSQVKATDKMETIVDDVNFGGCGVFVDGIATGYSVDIRGWGHRGIDKPELEQSIYGPQEAFSEMLRNNTALVRKTLKTEKLICEAIEVGKVSRTRGVIMYISDLANPDMIDEVRKRIKGIEMDYVIAIEEVSMMIEEKPFIITSHIMATERPDRVARALSEGRVAVTLNGSPRTLILPTNAFEEMHAASDAYMRIPYANMTRILRMMAMFISMLLPGLYMAITLYHQEMIPTYLLYSISAARENVPFPSIVELFLMDISFELIREAGIRMPGPLGSTLSIVGGLILGQAAVSAKIVSPIMIIVIAMTGIGSFATPDYSLGWSYRILRLGFIILGSICGFYGIAIGLFAYGMMMASQKSFGVPFLAPLVGRKRRNASSALFVSPIWKKERRPSYLAPEDDIQEPKISRRWNIGRKKM
jgi:spore germination protein KA